jgi:endonuclease YncB( thermonuclease family)
MNDTIEENRQRAQAATERVRELIEGKMVIIDSVKVAAYHRWEAKVAFLDAGTVVWTDLGTTLLAEGHAKIWQKR